MKSTKGRSRTPFIKPEGRSRSCCKLNGFDYKAVGTLKKYISDTGKIESSKRTGNCAKCQRNLTNAVKRARHLALLPYASSHRYDTSLVSLMQDDKLTEDTTVEEDEDKKDLES